MLVNALTNAALMCYRNYRKYKVPSQKLDMNGIREALYGQFPTRKLVFMIILIARECSITLTKGSYIKKHYLSVKRGFADDFIIKRLSVHAHRGQQKCAQLQIMQFVVVTRIQHKVYVFLSTKDTSF